MYFDNYAAGTSEVVTGTEYDFGTSVTDGCWVKVKAIADGYRNSNEAEGPKYSVGSVPVTYMITVTNGKAIVGDTEITKAAEGEKVTITANAAPDGQVFDKWVVESGSVTLASESNETTFFTMPAGEVSVKATYKKDILSVKNIDVTITAPQIGQTPDYDPVIDADPADSVEFQEAVWYKVAEDSYTGTDEDSWIKVMADEEFTAGYYYSVDLFLNTTGDNKMTDATTGTINGMPHNDTYSGIFKSDTSAYLCGVFEPIHEHIPGADWVNDSEKHWHVCYCGEDCEEAEHTAGDWIIDVAATAETDGSKHKECTVCGYIMETETIPAVGEEHTHSFDGEWKTNDEKHWHECSCGEKSDEEEHSFKWVVDKEATSTEKGSKHEECEACGYKRAAVEIPATGSETDPTKPTTPTTPTKPTNPSNSNESGKTTETAKTDNPATGENGMTALWIALIIASGFGFAATDAYRKKRKSLK